MGSYRIDTEVLQFEEFIVQLSWQDTLSHILLSLICAN